MKHDEECEGDGGMAGCFCSFRKVERLTKLLEETQRLLVSGAEGAIVDTVWCEDGKPCTLWEAIEMELKGPDDDEQRGNLYAIQPQTERRRLREL